MKKVTDKQIIDAIVVRGQGLVSFCKEHDLHFGTFCKRIRRMKDRGVIPETLAEGRAQERIAPEDTTLKDCYLNKGWGVAKIAKEYGLSQQTITLHLKRLGILDNSRTYQSSGTPSRRVRRPSSKEFTDTTKKLRFQEEKGVCELCGKQIGNGVNWRLACYHHRKPIKLGGGREPSNCMVLHSECHEEHSYELHGFDMDYYKD